MTSGLIDALIFCMSALYFLASVAVAYGVSRFRKGRSPARLPRVSVVLCARNEEDKIARCLDSLKKVDYPSDLMEIIIVDDESTDGTPEICTRYAAEDPRFMVRSTAGEPRTLIGKQRPLSVGIDAASGEFVLGLDADMAVRPGWIRAHAAVYTDGVGVAGGTSRIDPSYSGFFAGVQACDLITKMSVTMGSAGLGFPLTIMGNNLSFRKDIYDSFGGFRAMKPRIVEDLALMNEITRVKGFKLGWASGPDGVADSTPEDHLRTFIEQRRRWMNEAGDLSFAGKLTIALEILICAAFIAGLLTVCSNPVPFAAAAGAWFFGYCLLIAANPGSTPRDYRYLPLMIAFQIAYNAVLAVEHLFGRRRVVWKGREYS